MGVVRGVATAVRELWLAGCLWVLSLSLPVDVQARPALEPVPSDIFEKLFPLDDSVWSRRADVLRGIEHSLQYLRSADAERAYRRFENSGLSRANVIKSLLRFRTLLFRASSPTEFIRMLKDEFHVVRSRGTDGEGSVKFTGYFQPVYRASLVRTSHYRYPIYRLPSGFEDWPRPHYSRVFLEGYDGLGSKRSPLYGQELAFLSSRYEAYMIHVQGSAVLELPDGRHVAVGFAGATDHPFSGVPKSFLEQKKVRWSQIGEYFKEHPGELNEILARNNRYIFFKLNEFQSPVGSLGVPVVAKRSIATDKSLMPPGALGLINTFWPVKSERGDIRLSRKPQFVFDHDTGSAIKGPGRVDVFMGTGQEAGQLANHISSMGELYYLLLK